MTETTTPTDEVVDQSSSDIRDESLLEQDSEQNSAVEHQEDTDSSESNDSDSDSSSTSESKSDDSSDEDKGLAKFAKSQGFDPANLTDGEKKALKLAHENQKAYRKAKEEENTKKISDEVQELYQPDEDDGRLEVIEKKLAQAEAKNVTNEFWAQHPDDKQYEAQMVEALINEKKEYGDDAARRLAANLPRLLREAKFLAGADSSDAARDAGRRDERERLRKTQEGAADSAHASQSSSSATKKLTRESIEAMPYAEYESRRAEIDAAIARGDLY